MSDPRPAPGRGRALPALLSGLGVAVGLLIAARPRGPAATVRRRGGPRDAQAAAMRRGEPGTGGYHGVWRDGTSDGDVAEHIEFQYAGMEQQSDAALSGMWLFLATELLFFGSLFLLYMVYRAGNPHAFAEASKRSELLIGTVNTVLLLTSSAVFSWGLGRAKLGDNRRLLWACAITVAIGVVFLLLKGYEWKDDLDKNLFPGPGFAMTGPDSGAAQLFWSFYFISTGLHGLHMIIGVVLVTWLGWTARKGRYSPGYYTPVEIVGLYWSFVDMVWLSLYPMIYLVGRGGS